MKRFLIKLLSLFFRVFNTYSKWVEKLYPDAIKLWDDCVSARINNKITKVMHTQGTKKVELSFYTPNYICRYRANTFSTKEPETLEWIDRYVPEGAVLFDIGANVGLYSIYHAVTKKGLVYCFEPSVFNLKLLVRNININKCNDQVKIISNPLTSSNMFADFNLQNVEEGGALSSFGVDYNQEGNKLNIVTSYKTLGFSLDYLVDNRIIEDIPAAIKIDVDGIENLILRGAVDVLSHPACRSILIEVDDNFVEMAEDVNKILTTCGFTLLEKRANIEAFGNQNFTYNQIWIKK